MIYLFLHTQPADCVTFHGQRRNLVHGFQALSLEAPFVSGLFAAKSPEKHGLPHGEREGGSVNVFLLVSLWYLRQSQSLGSTPVTVTNGESLSKGPTQNARVGLHFSFLNISQWDLNFSTWTLGRALRPCLNPSDRLYVLSVFADLKLVLSVLGK